MSKKDLEECMKDIQNYIEDTRNPKEKNNLLKRKILYLGAKSKKSTINFKHIKMLKEHKRNKKVASKERLKAAGVVKRNNSKRK